MTTNSHAANPGAARRTIAALVALIGTIVWTHALVGLFRAILGIPVEEIAPAAVGLTLAAVAVAGGGLEQQLPEDISDDLEAEAWAVHMCA